MKNKKFPNLVCKCKTKEQHEAWRQHLSNVIKKQSYKLAKELGR